MIATSAEMNALISKELHVLFSQINSALEQHKSLLDGSFSDEVRKALMDALGEAGSHYRQTVYEKRFSGEKEIISKAALLSFLKNSYYLFGTLDCRQQKSRRHVSCLQFDDIKIK